MPGHTDVQKDVAEQTSIPAWTLDSLRAAIRHAAASHDWPTVVALATEALALPGVTPEAAFELLDTRATAFRYMADFAASQADGERMAAVARELDDLDLEIRAVTSQLETTLLSIARGAGERLLEAAGALAKRSSDPRAEALLMLTSAAAANLRGDLRETQEHGERALRMYQELGDEHGQALCQRNLFHVAYASGQPARAGAIAEQVLELSRRIGDREGEGIASNLQGMTQTDRAQSRAKYEQALAVAEAIGHQPVQVTMFNNLAGIYAYLGMYRRAIDYAERAVVLARRVQARGGLAYFLDTLARAYLGMGRLERAEQAFVEGRATAREVADRAVEACYPLGLGWVALANGRPAEAVQHFEEAAEIWSSLGRTTDVGVLLAWKGAAHLALGEVDAAVDATARSVALVEAGNITFEYAPQDVWWWRYRALTAPHHPSPPTPLPHGERGASPPSPLVGEGAGDGGDAAWRALDRARDAMVGAISTLSDDGLRRSFLNKVAVNRAIVEEWLLQATRRGLPLEPLTDHLSGAPSAEEQLKRMLDVGVRLSARREEGELSDQVLDEVVELTGAERAALLLIDDAGTRRVAAASVIGRPVAAQNLDVADAQLAWLAALTPILDEAADKRVPVLRHLPSDAPALEQASVLCTPLNAPGGLVGLVCAELGGHFGRFSPRDRDLLAVLANQAAVALENAAWADTLEQRVEDRTAELSAANAHLEERTRELEIINSIGQGLARQLDFQAIIDLVGDKITEIFSAQASGIHLLDRQAGLVRPLYYHDLGHRGHGEP
ncbi:MAG: tetratricopeptide repeat protein, partial [Anaerolineae bacterium]|nr:tetratricopeptide repeat protein [Anaerolineae bacterium]